MGGRLLVAASAAVMLACSGGGTIIVQVRTDLAPGIELAEVTTEHLGRTFRVDASGERGWIRGVRVAEIAVDAGEHRLTVSALGPDGIPRVSRPLRLAVEDGEVLVATVLLTRSCEGIACPLSGDDASDVACLAGRCVPDGCSEERPDRCGVAECMVPSDCPAMTLAPCAMQECTPSGACFVATDHEACTDAEVCDATGGCVVDCACAARPTYAWDFVFGSPGLDSVHRAAIDASGGVVVTGSFSGPIDFGGGTRANQGGRDACIIGLGSDGRYRWDVVFGGADGDDWARGVAFDASGDVVVTGEIRSGADLGGGSRSARENDVFLANYRSDGSYISDQTFPGRGADDGYRVATHADGALTVVGGFGIDVDLGGGLRTGGGGFATKRGSDGSYLWDFILPSTVIYGAAPDASGGVLAAGSFSATIDLGDGPRTPVDGADAFLARLDSEGSPTWGVTFGGPGLDVVLDAAVHADSATVGGYFEESADFGGGARTGGRDLAAFVASYDLADGAYRWAVVINADVAAQIFDIALDDAGNVMVAGFYTGSADFGGGPRASGMSGTGSVLATGFLAAYGPDGSYLWDVTYPAANAVNLLGVAVRGGSIIVTGYFAGGVDFGGGVRTSTPGGSDAFVVALTCPCL